MHFPGCRGTSVKRRHLPNRASQKRGYIWLLLAVLAASGTLQAQTHSPATSPAAPTPTIGNPSQPATRVVEEDIRDVRAPRHIAYSWLWAAWLAAGMVGGGLLVWAWRHWKNRPKIRIKTAHEIALEKLRKALALMNPDQAREFSIVVSDAVRVYIEARFHSGAAHRTTEEFLHNLLSDTSSPLARYSDSLGEFLKHCDLAKFAKWALSVPEMESMHESARKLIEETKPSTDHHAIKGTPLAHVASSKTAALLPA